MLGSRRRGQVQARNGARRRELKPNRTSLKEPDSDTDNGIGVIIQHDLFVPTGAYRVRTGANSGVS